MPDKTNLIDSLYERLLLNDNEEIVLPEDENEAGEAGPASSAGAKRDGEHKWDIE